MSMAIASRPFSCVKLLSKPLYRSVNRLVSVRHINNKDIKTLEDLTKLDSLKGVEPELIKRLIDERTSELNTKNELEMLKNFNKEEELLRQSPLKKFTRPFWIFLIMSSTVYLVCHYIWWRLEYEEKEIDYAKQVVELETELAALLKQKDGKRGDVQERTCDKPWYRRWFF